MDFKLRELQVPPYLWIVYPRVTVPRVGVKVGKLGLLANIWEGGKLLHRKKLMTLHIPCFSQMLPRGWRPSSGLLTSNFDLCTGGPLLYYAATNRTRDKKSASREIIFCVLRVTRMGVGTVPWKQLPVYEGSFLQACLRACCEGITTKKIENIPIILG